MNELSLFDLEGKTAVITGGATGLGKAMAKALANAGANIVIGDLNIKLAEKTINELVIKKKGFAFKLDVTRKEQVQNFTNKIVEKFGYIDILVNNAGICSHENAEEMSWENWSKVIDVNLNGVFLMSQLIGRIMIRQKYGSIINIASMSGIIANTPQAQCSYNSSKAGVIMLTKSLASEWAKYNIRVNAIAPGYMKTDLTKRHFEVPGIGMGDKWIEMIPMKRPGKPSELGGIVLYLASEASTYATGAVFVIDGGYTVW